MYCDESIEKVLDYLGGTYKISLEEVAYSLTQKVFPDPEILCILNDFLQKSIGVLKREVIIRELWGILK